ncbi:MAG: YncE family protein [Terriglobales bacterium]
MKKTLIGLAAVVAASVTIVACGGGYGSSSSNGQNVSGLKFRAFVSNPLFSGGGGSNPVLNIMDASKDVLSGSTVSLAGSQGGLMVVSPNLRFSLVVSPTGTITVIDNTTEAAAHNGTATVSPINLPGATESIVIAKDSTTVYAALPAAEVLGQPPGAVVKISLSSGSVQASIPVPAARFLALSPDGNNLLVFSDNSNSVTLIDTVLIGTNNNPIQLIAGFDRPVWAIFANNTTAYVFNCGAECPGGVAAGLTTLDVGTLSPGPIVPLSGATYALLNGGLLYVAGTPPHTACPPGTAASTCGTLSIVDVNAMRVTNPSPILITDGYHNRMEMGANGQLFVGARSCTSINNPGGEVRGCLSIFNSNTAKVVIPPQVGDATGIAPIPGRTVVYVCQGGVFQMFDTTTDKLLVQVNLINGVPTNIVGDSIDVKVVDPPPAKCIQNCT